MKKIVGIDFGTSNVRITQWDADSGENSSSCQIGSISPFTMPTVIAFQRQPDGKVITTYGEDADALDDRAPDVEVIRNIKRWVLTSDDYVRQQVLWHLAQRDQSPPEWWDFETRSIRIWDEDVKGEDAIKQILKEAISRSGLAGAAAEWRAGCPVDSNLAYRNVLVSALDELGCTGRINWIAEEPLLLLTLGRAINSLEDGLRCLVYDVGGGSFDCAIVDANDDQLIVLASEGLPVGGTDIDDMLMKHLDYDGPDQFLRVAKEQLYSEGAPEEINLGGGQTLSRNDVENVLEGFMNETMRAIMNAYNKAQLQIRGSATYGGRQSELIESMRNEIDRVLVVGGPTHMPYFATKLKETFGYDKVVEAEDLTLAADRGDIPDARLTALSHGACYMYDRDVVRDRRVENRYTPLTVDRIPAKITLSVTDGSTTVQDSYQPFQRLPFRPPTDPHVGDMIFRRAVNEGEVSALDPIVDSAYSVLIEDADGQEIGHWGPIEMRMPRDGYTGPRADRIRLVVDRLGRVGVELGAGFTHVPKPLRDLKLIAESTVWQTEAQRKVIEYLREQQRLRETRAVGGHYDWREAQKEQQR